MMKSILKKTGLALSLICVQPSFATETNPTGDGVQTITDDGLTCECSASIGSCVNYIKDQTGWPPLGFILNFKHAQCIVAVEEYDDTRSLYQGYCSDGSQTSFVLPDNNGETFSDATPFVLSACQQVQAIYVSSS